MFKAEGETADLWQPKWNENQAVLAQAIHTPDRDTEFGDCGVIPGRGLLLTVERDIERRRGRRLWWEIPVVGNSCGGKPGSHGSKAVLLSHTFRVQPSP